MGNEDTALARIPHAEPFQPENLGQALELSKEIAQAAIIPQHLRNRPADVYATLLLGRDLGLTPMQAIMGIYCVEGKPSLSAQTAVALVKRSPLCKYFRLVEGTDQTAIYETQRHGDPEPQRMKYTIADAARAGLASKNTWKSHPAAMLRARAAMSLARDVYPDVVANLYDPDELDELRDRVAQEKITAPPRPTTAPPNGRAPSGEQAAPAGTVPSQIPAGAEPDRGPDELRDFGAQPKPEPWPPEGTRQPEPGEAGTDAQPPAEPFDPADAAMQKVVRAKSFAEQRAVRPEFEGAIRDLPPAERDAMWQTYVDKLLKWIPIAAVTDMGPLATEVRELRKMKLIGDEKYTPALEAFKKREAARTGEQANAR